MMMYALRDFESGLCPPNHSTIGSVNELDWSMSDGSPDI